MNIVETVARAIALGHGAKMVYQHPTEGMQTVASMAGFGRWGHSPEKYSDAHWKDYVLAAQFAIPLVAKALPEMVGHNLYDNEENAVDLAEIVAAEVAKGLEEIRRCQP